MRNEARRTAIGGRGWFARLNFSGADRLRAWLPPIDRREFWAVQVLVLMIAGIHSFVETEHVLSEYSSVYFFTTTLYLIPVVYAAVNFGMRGAVLTALWSAVLVIPNVLLVHHGLARLGEIIQVTWITAAAVFVGSRVDRERSARLEAEFQAERQRVSEERYRAIVNNVDEPIILLDAERRIVEANAAAASLLGRSVSDLRGQRPPGPAGYTICEALANQQARTEPMPRVRLGQPERWYEPVRTNTTDALGTPVTQLLLLDVTASFEREQGLEGITYQTIAAREEEQRRIARELHDGPLQSLVTLWRELDAAAVDVPDIQRDRLLRARGTAEDVADELRRFSRDLRPSVLDDLGIAAALRSEAERLRERSGIAVQVDVTGDARRLPGEVEVALLRIAQEALRNVERHSQATTVHINLDLSSPSVTLRVADDGIGLDPIPSPSALLAGSHLGVIGMQERARMVGGSLALARSAAGGLDVLVVIPDRSASH